MHVINSASGDYLKDSSQAWDREALRLLSFGLDDVQVRRIERASGANVEADQLKGISQEVWEQERDKAAQRMAEASSEIQQVLRQSMADLVAHMAERLKDGADGKPLKFKQSTVSNLVEFLSNFSFRNVTDDRQLQDLVGQARELLQGVTPDDLRTSGDMRTRVQQGMAALAANLDGMLVKTGGRKMRLAEEET